MLRKLMKHEFRATGRVMLPLFLLVLITSAGANLSAGTLIEAENDFLNLLGMLLMMAFVSAIAGVCIVAFAMMIQRFYKNLLQDEGYVMMTLPVSVHQHVWSKLLVSMIWYVATVAVIAAAFVILAFDVGFLEQLSSAIGEIISALRFGDEAVQVVPVCMELLLLMFFSCAGACLQFYAAMAVGHSFGNHKMIMSVVVYFGTQFALQLLGGGFLAFVNNTGLDYAITQALPTFPAAVAVHLWMLVMIVFAILFAAVFYFVTVYFMKRHLNLE